MGQVSGHPRNLASYVYYDRGQELRCSEDPEVRPAAPYSHSESGSKLLQVRYAILAILSALIIMCVQQSCASPKKPENVIIHNYYGCSASEVIRK